jgi:hypothetical protein
MRDWPNCVTSSHWWLLIGASGSFQNTLSQSNVVDIQMAVARTENLTPYADVRRAEIHDNVRGAFAHFLQLEGSQIVHWSPHRTMAKGIGHVLVRIEAGEGIPPIAFDIRDDQAPQHRWLERDGVFFDLRDNDDGSSSREHPAQLALLESLRNRLETTSDELYAQSRSRLEKSMQVYNPWHDVDDGAFRQISWANGQAYGILRLSFRCNQDCSFCWQSRSWPSPSAEQYHQWLEEMVASGVKLMIFSGGEPTIFKGITELIRRAAKDFGLRTQIQTNAIQFRRRDFALKLRKAGLKEAFISFHSADAEISDGLTRAPGTHVHTVAGIKNAIDVGIRVHLNAVVERANYKSLEAQAQFIADEFVQARFFKRPRLVTYSHPCHAYEAEHWDESVVPLDEVRPHVIAAAKILKEANIPIQVIGSCGFPPCLFKDAPELISWVDRDKYDSGDVSGRSFPEACTTCAVKSRCMGVRNEYLGRYGDRGITPFEKVPKVGWWPFK